MAEILSYTSKTDIVCKSHISFLKWASRNSRQVIFPLSAYIYDEWRLNNSYRNIKLGVFLAVKKYRNIYFPVIHPLIHQNSQISRIKNIFDKYLPINIFSYFDKKIYITDQKELQSIYNIKNKKQVFDVYSRHVKISSIFTNNNKREFKVLSLIFFQFVKIFTLTPGLKLLINGRKIKNY